MDDLFWSPFLYGNPFSSVWCFQPAPRSVCWSFLPGITDYQVSNNWPICLGQQKTFSLPSQGEKREENISFTVSHKRAESIIISMAYLWQRVLVKESRNLDIIFGTFKGTDSGKTCGTVQCSLMLLLCCLLLSQVSVKQRINVKRASCKLQE